MTSQLSQQAPPLITISHLIKRDPLNIVYDREVKQAKANDREPKIPKMMQNVGGSKSSFKYMVMVGTSSE